jgi:hypothetical protein
MLTEELKHELIDVNILISTKKVFTPAEANRIYALYNIITGENKVPNGCSACMNNTISRIKKTCRDNEI